MIDSGEVFIIKELAHNFSLSEYKLLKFLSKPFLSKKVHGKRKDARKLNTMKDFSNQFRFTVFIIGEIRDER